MFITLFSTLLGTALCLGGCSLSAPDRTATGDDPTSDEEPVAGDPAGWLRAGREMRIDAIVDRVHFAFKPEADRFVAGHSTHAAVVDRGVLTFTPYHHPDDSAVVTAPPMELETTAIYRGDQLVDTTYRSAAVDRGTGRLRVSRAQVVEEFRNDENGIEQSWHFAAPPGSEGDLVVEVAVVGPAFSTATDSGLHFTTAAGLGFRYTHATWIGADGTDVPIRADYVGGAIRMVVPEDVLSGTTFPAVLDPTASAETAVDAPVVGWTGAGARRAAISPNVNATQFLVVWQDDRSGVDRDIFGTRITAAGAIVDPLGIAISEDAGDQDNPAVSFASGRYVVAWQDGADIRAARVQTSGVVTQLGAVAAGASPVPPRLASRGASALLAYQAGDDVRAALFNGLTFGAVFDVAATAAVEREPAVAANPAGDFLVTWTEGDEAPDLRGRLVTAAGAPNGDAFDVSAAAGGQSQSAASFTGENFAVVFADNNQGLDIYGTRVSPTGIVLDTRTQGTGTVGGVPITTAASSQTQPDVSCRAGGCLVAWTDRRNFATSGFDVFAAVLNSDLSAAGPEFALASFVRDQRSPALAASSTGWLTGWHDGRHGGGDAVHVARVAASGAITDPNGIMVVTGNNRESSPTIAESATSWLLAWSDSRQFGADIRGLRVRFTGVSLDTATRPLSTATGHQGSPDAARFGTGTILAWNDARGASDDIFAARVDAAGTVLDPDGIAISTDAASQVAPEVASDGSNALVVWQDRRNGNFDVFGALVDGGGNVVATDIQICAADGDQQSPSVAFDATNDVYLVAWADRRGDSFDIFAARVDPSGGVLESCGAPVSAAAEAQNNPDVTFGGGRFFVAWEDRRSGASDVFGARVAASGGTLAVLDPDGVAVATAAGDQTEPVAVFARQSYLVAWTDGRSADVTATDIVGAQVSTTGLVSGEFVIAAGAEAESIPAMATNPGASVALVAYSRRVPSLDTSRVFYRLVTGGTATGSTCGNDAQCESGFCVDGRCCDSACGGTDTGDCQACSTRRGAAQDGICGVVEAGRVCRTYADTFCDRREVCDGTSIECPEDIGRREGVVCDEACGAVCPANDETGSPHVCPVCP